jgi:hypothetical protein
MSATGGGRAPAGEIAAARAVTAAVARRMRSGSTLEKRNIEILLATGVR